MFHFAPIIKRWWVRTSFSQNLPHTLFKFQDFHLFPWKMRKSQLVSRSCGEKFFFILPKKSKGTEYKHRYLKIALPPLLPGKFISPVIFKFLWKKVSKGHLISKNCKGKSVFILKRNFPSQFRYKVDFWKFSLRKMKNCVTWKFSWEVWGWCNF